MTAPRRLSGIVAILVLGGGLLSTHRGVTSSRSQPARDIALAASDASPHPHRSATEGDGVAVDLYGNEVNDAIATYTLDPTGSLYELHSPQTELPRLGGPKS